MTGNGPPLFRERLRHGAPLLLDAAMGSDLNRRGLPTTLPLWSALGLLERPELVRQIHLDNLLAGADIITTDTFCTTGSTLRKAGLDPARAAELDTLAVRLAREARTTSGRPHALIAGSIAPLEDCYRPTFDTPPEIALAEHRAQARNLAAAGVDLLMVETMPTATEARIALQAATETVLPATIGFVCAAPEQGEPVRLLSGEPLADAVALVLPFGPAAIFVNCAAPDVITAALQELATLSDVQFGAYANVGHVDDEVGWSPAGGISGEGYAAHARDWLTLGSRIVGGCCGTHPAHTAAMRQMIDALAFPPLPARWERGAAG
ncbi:MAG: homocysteine S-methyltransferase family protein [Chloroflexota bacterium]|nr:homocysteine S-methyltransferase family protein [Chloroflexia bacterium]MDQ3227343.1 homocysteine S-methyltransferase family protein [Chloroflexota bacterium]